MATPGQRDARLVRVEHHGVQHHRGRLVPIAEPHLRGGWQTAREPRRKPSPDLLPCPFHREGLIAPQRSDLIRRRALEHPPIKVRR